MEGLMVTAIRVFVILVLAQGLTGCLGLQLQPQERSFVAAIDDLRIQTELNADLFNESAGLFANVDSTVIEGRVHLTGSVPTQEDRIRVTRLAWSVRAVREVVNDVDVTMEVGLADTAKDHWITAQVRARILDARDIRDSNYSIDTENGVIYVSGIAQDQRELDRVLRLAGSVPEGRRVVSYVMMKDDPRRFARPGKSSAERVASAREQ
jgi:osmotically-inducible protein OsmY